MSPNLTKAANVASQGERLLAALANRGQGTVSELAADTGISARSASAALARLVAAGKVRRLGRGVVAVADRPVARHDGVHVGPDAQRILSTLAHAKIPAQLSGYDLLAPFANQLASSWMHLVYVDRGSGEWAADALRAAGYAPAVEPGREQLNLLADLGPQRVVILRERALGDRPAPTRRLEDAWVDLMVEQRAGYPIGLSEMGELLRGLQLADVSWTRLARAAQRRSLPLRVDASRRPVPLAVEPDAAPDLERVLRG
jgi:DNA-binding transcriptional ArsR family regulator